MAWENRVLKEGGAIFPRQNSGALGVRCVREAV